MPGPRPKPTHLRLLAGNPGHRPINRDEPQPAGDLTEPPAWLTDSQKEGWKYAIAKAPGGLLRQLDQSMLTVWVVAEDMHRFASEKVQKHGALVKVGSNGAWQQNPYMPIMNKQALLMMKAAGEMGFSPSSRTRVRIEQQRDAGNAFEDLKEFADE